MLNKFFIILFGLSSQTQTRNKTRSGNQRKSSRSLLDKENSNRAVKNLRVRLTDIQTGQTTLTC